MLPCLLLVALGTHVNEFARQQALASMERDWGRVLAPARLDDRLRHWFWRLDPRPDSSFRPFTSERLDAAIAAEGKQWCRYFFQAVADPYRSGLTGPTKYSLAPIPGRQSLVRYEWENDRYRFVLLEGSAALLLEVHLKRNPEMPLPGSQWTRGQIVRLLQELFNEEASRNASWLESFRLPAELPAGTCFSNSRDLFPRALKWPPDLLGIVGRDVLWLMVLKGHPSARISWTYPEDQLWLPVMLHEPDGKRLVIETLWGMPYPRKGRIQPLIPRWSQ